MPISSVVKNFRDGLIAMEDATGTPISITVQYEEGNFSGSGFSEGDTEVTTYLDRGVLGSVRKTTRTFPTFTFSAHMTDLSDGTEKNLWDAVNKLGAFAAGVSTLGANEEVWTLKVTFTIEGTDHGDAADHVFTFNDCHMTIDFAEGDPNSFTINGTVYGSHTES